jgi:putative oxidoreductase
MTPRIDLESAGKLVLRLAIGGLLLFHGVDKLIGGIDGIVGRIDRLGLPSLLAYGVYVGEVVAPILILVGFATRPAGVVLAFNMVVAILLAHAGDVVRLGKSGQWAVELQMMYLLGGVAIALLGAGRYSVSRGKGRLD